MMEASCFVCRKVQRLRLFVCFDLTRRITLFFRKLSLYFDSFCRLMMSLFPSPGGDEDDRFDVHASHYVE